MRRTVRYQGVSTGAAAVPSCAPPRRSLPYGVLTICWRFAARLGASRHHRNSAAAPLRTPGPPTWAGSLPTRMTRARATLVLCMNHSPHHGMWPI